MHIKPISAAILTTSLLVSCIPEDDKDNASTANKKPQSSFTFQSGSVVANSTDDNGLNGLTYQWTVNGTPAGTSLVLDTSALTGVVMIGLTTTDAGGLSHTTEHEINFGSANTSQPPTAIAAASVTQGVAPVTITFDGSGSTDDVMVTSYSWVIDGQTYNTHSADHLFNVAGNYLAALTVKDADGQMSTDTINVQVTSTGVDLTPVAAFTTNVSSGNAPLLVSFDASGSMDDHGIDSYSWNFGDGASSTLLTPSHSYTNVGVYDVVLTVTDTANQSSTLTTQIIVNNASVNTAPNAVLIASNISGAAPLSINFDASTSSDAQGVSGLIYSWDFGDGTHSSEVSPTKVFNTSGSYNVELTVSDGALSDVDTQRIDVGPTVVNQPPTANFTHTAAGLTVSVDANTSSDPENGNLTYSWDFNSEASKSGVTESYTFAQAGVKSIELTVIDNGGARDTHTVSVTVTDPSGGNENVSLVLDAPQMDIYQINNCGTNPLTNADVYKVMDGQTLQMGNAKWNHINSMSGPWDGITQSPSAYNIANGYNSTANNCQMQQSMTNILVKKYGDWDQQHANGFNINVQNTPTFADIETLVMDVYVDSANTVLPTLDEVKQVYGGLMTNQQIEEMDDGDIHFDVQLQSTGAFAASVDLKLTRNDLDKWLRVEIPVRDMDLWENVNYVREPREWVTMQSMPVNAVSFMAETANRKVYRHYASNFNVNTAPKLFKEESIELKRIELTKFANNSVTLTPAFSLTESAMTVSADASASSGSAAFTYSWDFGGEFQTTGQSASYTFTTAGNKAVTLTLTSGSTTQSLQKNIMVMDTNSGYAALLSRVNSNVVSQSCSNCHVNQNRAFKFRATSSHTDQDVEDGIKDYLMNNSAQRLINFPNGSNHRPGDQIPTIHEQDWEDLVNAIDAM